MKSETLCGEKELREGLAERRLATNFPKLRPYLYREARVLDVGCGPGTITMGIAKEVDPGPVVGIDLDARCIEQAQNIASREGITNVEFRVGDGHSLGFGDDSFDITCSHHALQWIRDPIVALTEQKRVTRAGGMVIARTGCHASLLFYPPLPIWKKIDKVMDQFIRNDPDIPLGPADAGLRSLEWLTKAGLSDIRIEVDGFLTHYGSENFDRLIKTERIRLDPKGPAEEYYRMLVSSGRLDPETIVEARKELEDWAKNPYASCMGGTFFVIGRA